MSSFLLLTEKRSTIENLNLMKEHIKAYCNNNDMNLRLLRSYYYTLKSNNEQIIWQTIIGFCVVIFGYLLKGIMLDDFSLSIFGAKFSPFQLFIGFITLILIIYKDIFAKRDKTILVYKIIDELVNANENEK